MSKRCASEFMQTVAKNWLAKGQIDGGLGYPVETIHRGLDTWTLVMSISTESLGMGSQLTSSSRFTTW